MNSVLTQTLINRRQDLIDAVLEELRRSLPDADDSDRIYAARRVVEIVRPDLFD